MTTSTKVLWRIQARKSRQHAWKNVSGLYETREAARWWQHKPRAIFGFGNTRIQRYEKASRK